MEETASLVPSAFRKSRLSPDYMPPDLAPFLGRPVDGLPVLAESAAIILFGLVAILIL